MLLKTRFIKENEDTRIIDEDLRICIEGSTEYVLEIHKLIKNQLVTVCSFEEIDQQ